MPYVITEKCLEEVYAACVDVCPADCIHPGDYKGKAFMIIDPEACTECTSCLDACPIGAIVASVEEAPEDAKLNAELSAAFGKNPPIQPRPENDPPRRADNKLVKG